MPSRLRNSAAAETAHKEPGYAIPGLKFDQTLSWRAGKAIPVGDLLARLQKLAAELRNYDLDQVESRAFTTLAQGSKSMDFIMRRGCAEDLRAGCAIHSESAEGGRIPSWTELH
jgi:hypothetical protein